MWLAMRKFEKRDFLLVLVISCLSVSAFAGNDYPTTGTVYNTKEDSSIMYNCSKARDEKLECELVQTFVRKQTKPSEWNKKLAEAKKQMPDAVKELSKDNGSSCKLMSVLARTLDGKLNLKEAAEETPKNSIFDQKGFFKYIKGMSESKRQEMYALATAMEEFCKTKSEESYIKVAKLGIEKEMHTCRIGSNPFKETFKWVSDYSGKGAWVAEAQPSGACGVVQLNRFETGLVDGKFTLWNYIAKKAVTNPKGEAPFIGKCADALDQDEYLYNWKNERDSLMDCKYIEFSPF